MSIVVFFIFVITIIVVITAYLLLISAPKELGAAGAAPLMLAGTGAVSITEVGISFASIRSVCGKQLHPCAKNLPTAEPHTGACQGFSIFFITQKSVDSLSERQEKVLGGLRRCILPGKKLAFFPLDFNYSHTRHELAMLCQRGPGTRQVVGQRDCCRHWGLATEALQLTVLLYFRRSRAGTAL
jgi:hypothetical protein